MRLIPYRGDDFGGLIAMRERMNDLFGPLVRGGETPMFGGQPWLPSVDIVETPETLQVKAEVPGFDPKDIEISVVGDTLTIKGEKTAEKEEKGKTWHRRECTSGTFFRSVTLPVEIDPDHVEAVEEAGVLTITLPKRVHATAKHITIKTK